MTDFQMGAAGDPTEPQLPYGAATEANDASAAAAPSEAPSGGAGGAGAEPLPPGVSGQPATAPPFTPVTEDEKFLFAPPEQGDSTNPMAGLTPSGALAPPEDIHQWLPYLAEAAAAPDANDNTRMLFNLIAGSLGQQ